MLDEKKRCSTADNSRELRCVTCLACGCDLAAITRVIQMGDEPIWLEFAGECGHRWSYATGLAKSNVNILPFDLTDYLWESYRVLTKHGERSASSISIELFFGTSFYV